MTTVLKVDTDGTVTELVLDGSLDGFIAAIGGGWLEAITGPGWSAFCDEEGKIKGLPPNTLATGAAILLGWGHGDVLCGPVLFLGPPDRHGNETDVPAKVREVLAGAS
jgi:hypothetical protein